MLADVVHAIRFGPFRVVDLVNPNRLRHKVPPASSMTVAYEQAGKQLAGGADVLRRQFAIDTGYSPPPPGVFHKGNNILDSVN